MMFNGTKAKGGFKKAGQGWKFGGDDTEALAMWPSCPATATDTTPIRKWHLQLRVFPREKNLLTANEEHR